MFSAGISKQISGGNVDPQFNYVTALLHGDGTNGAQNNTFVDTSGNGLTISRNGTPTQGTLSPYGALWSNYFDGASASNLPVPSNPVAATGAFTVECWVYVTNSAVSQAIYSQYSAAAGRWQILWNDVTNKFSFAIAATSYNSTNTYAGNAWHHIAWVRDGSNNLSFYIDGVRDSTNAGVSTSLETINPTIANRAGNATPYYGYISNLRITNTAVYTGTSYTIPITPLTAITGTTLLTCQNNSFKDNSTNNYTMNPNGSGVSVQRFNPFLPTSTQAYSTSVIGGSGYFNGSGDYLTAPDSTQTDLGLGNFTVECWFYQFSSKVTSCISMYTATGTGYAMGASSTANKTWWYANSASQILSSATFNYNAWNHLAVARSGGTTTMYLNGVSVGSFLDSINYVGTTTYIGVDEFSQYWNGYISDARIVKGTAVYTSNFTPPTSPLTAITNTSLLCNMQNAGIYDNAMQNDILTVSTTYPSITTANKQYGTGSIYSQATGNYLYFPKSNTFYMGSGDFTIEFWIYCNSNSGAIIDQFPNASGSYLTGQYNIILLTTNKLMFTVAASASSTASFTTTGSFATNTWTHVALVRSSGVLKFYINGTADATTLTSSLVVGMTQVAGYMMNAANGQTNPMVGYLDDVRMTPGFARYTSNFTRPSAAFPNYGR